MTETKLDINKIRSDFPILNEKVYCKPLIYLDNAATTQKPLSVIKKISDYYSFQNSNIHRGVHKLSQIATEEYEGAREIVKNFIKADSTEEIIFTRGTTESINLVASSFGRKYLKEGDEVLISEMEHHSNIVPWQLICEQTGAKLKVIPINDDGDIIFEEFEKLINKNTKIVSVVHVSNSLGTINPIKEIIDISHSYGAKVLIDGAQSVQHLDIDVRALDCDFFAFSGHKIYGPTGIGVLYGKKEILNDIPPYHGGGDMIKSVSFDRTIYNDLPYKFEGGTPNIAGAIGLGEALKYIESIGIKNIEEYELELLEYGTMKLNEVDKLHLIGQAKRKSSALAFIIDGIHPHDIGSILDLDGVAVRTGHHCTEPVMQHFKVPATTRASISFYNTKEEIDILVNSIFKVIDMFN